MEVDCTELEQRLRQSFASQQPLSRIEALYCLRLRAGPLTDEGLRVQCWRALLGIGPSFDEAGESAAIQGAVREGTLPPKCARTIRKDAERTRGEFPCFFSEEGQARISALLTYYCLRGHTAQSALGAGAGSANAVVYRQGLNEILAGVLMAAPEFAGRGTLEGMSDGLAMALLSRLVALYAPRVYTAASDPGLVSLQCSLQLFRLFLQYHDPGLANFLSSYSCSVELFATSWLLTLFARSTPLPCALALFDFLVACARRPGPCVLHALAIAFLSSHREAILASPTQGIVAAELPVLLAKLAWRDVGHVREVCAAALNFLRDSPASFRSLLAVVAYGATIAPSPALLTRLEAQLCLHITVAEMLAGCNSHRYAHLPPPSPAPAAHGTAAAAAAGREPLLSKARAEGGLGLLVLSSAAWEEGPRYFVLDVRSAAEVERDGALPTAFNVPPDLLSDAEGLDAMLLKFSHLRGEHFVLSGSGDVTAWYHAPQPPHLAPAAAAAAGPPPPSPRHPTLHDLGMGDEMEDRSGGGRGGQGMQEEAHCTRLAVMLLQRGFCRVTIVSGGFTALHQLQAHFLSEVLVNHYSQTCSLCCPRIGGGSGGGGGGGGGGSRSRPAQRAPAAASPSGGAASAPQAKFVGRERGTPSPPMTPTMSFSDFLALRPASPSVCITPMLIAAGVEGVDEEGRFLYAESLHLDQQLDRILQRRSASKGCGKAAGAAGSRRLSPDAALQTGSGRLSPNAAVTVVKGATHPLPPFASASASPLPRLRALSGSLLQSITSPPPAGNQQQAQQEVRESSGLLLQFLSPPPAGNSSKSTAKR